MSCTDLKEECEHHPCQRPSRVTMQSIHNFLQDHDTYNTSIVYIRKESGEGADISELCCKEIEHDCHIFFSKKDDFYYFYNALLHRLILWSRHPRAFGKEGLIGTHVTIGPDKNKPGGFNIHETRYGYSKAHVGDFRIISPDAKYVYYKLDKKQQISLKGKEEVSPFTQFLWDLFRCPPSISSLRGGSPKLKKLLDVKPTKSSTFDFRAVCSTIDRLLKPFKKQQQHGFIRTPYIPRHHLVRVANHIRSSMDDYELQLISNHEDHCTFVALLVH